jgi:hypothetical protein
MGWGFGIRDPEKKLIPDPGSGGKKSTESRIPIHNTKFLYHKWLLKMYIHGMSRCQKLVKNCRRFWKQNMILLIARGITDLISARPMPASSLMTSFTGYFATS